MGRVNVKKLVEEFGERKREKKNKKKKITYDVKLM